MSMFSGMPPVNREILHDTNAETANEIARHAEQVRAQHGEDEPRRGLLGRLRSAMRR